MMKLLNLKSLEPTTRLAIQAAAALLLATLLAPLFHWQRTYWAELTAMLMISQTLGDSIKKSVERVSMTIIGGAFGTLLFFLTVPFHDLQIGLLMLSLFFCIFFLNSFYLWSVFFTSMLVVFIFAMIQNWTIVLLGWRIIETLFGATMAIIAATFILPIRTRDKLEQELDEFIIHLSHLTRTGLQSLINQQVDIAYLGHQQQTLLNELNRLQQRLVSMRFELVFHPQQRRHLRRQLKTLVRWYDLLSGWLEILKTETFNTHDYQRQRILKQVEAIINYNLAVLATASQQPLANLMPLMRFIRHRVARSLKQRRLGFADAFHIYNHVHTLHDINAILMDLR